MEDNELKQLQKYGATERFYTESKLYPDYQLARVIAQYRGKYKVITDQQEFFAEISGKFRYTTEELVQFPTVGDFVMVTVEKEFASIHQVLTRKSLFFAESCWSIQSITDGCCQYRYCFFVYVPKQKFQFESYGTIFIYCMGQWCYTSYRIDKIRFV